MLVHVNIILGFGEEHPITFQTAVVELGHVNGFDVSVQPLSRPKELVTVRTL
jgi:hypothetical protein